MYKDYHSALNQALNKAFAQEKFFQEGAQFFSNTVQNNGLIYVYGSGHSHMMGEEMFYRAGGLANVYPIYIEKLMLHKAAVTASVLEKEEGLVLPYLQKYDISSKDTFIVVSTSGRNATPVEAALYAKEKGAKILTISSFAYSRAQKPAHQSGKYLMDIGDLNLDNCVPSGDASLHYKDFPVVFAPLSTVVNAAVLNAITAQAIALLYDSGASELPVFLSGNLPEGAAHNKALIEKYNKRISPLK